MRIVGAKATASQPAKREAKPVEQQVEAQTPPKVQVKQKAVELQESVQAPEPVPVPVPEPEPEQKPDPDPGSVRQSSAKAHDPRVPEALAQKLNEGFEAEWRFKGNV